MPISISVRSGRQSTTIQRASRWPAKQPQSRSSVKWAVPYGRVAALLLSKDQWHGCKCTFHTVTLLRRRGLAPPLVYLNKQSACLGPSLECMSLVRETRSPSRVSLVRPRRYIVLYIHTYCTCIFHTYCTHSLAPVACSPPLLITPSECFLWYDETIIDELGISTPSMSSNRSRGHGDFVVAAETATLSRSAVWRCTQGQKKAYLAQPVCHRR